MVRGYNGVKFCIAGGFDGEPARAVVLVPALCKILLCAPEPRTMSVLAEVPEILGCMLVLEADLDIHTQREMIKHMSVTRTKPSQCRMLSAGICMLRS